MTTHRHRHGHEPAGPLGDDGMVTPERSVFGTRVPRPTHVGRHLVIVLVVFVAALAVAIFFAEGRQGDAGERPSLSAPAQNTP